MMFPVKKKDYWPMYDTYKGYQLEIFKDGSCNIKDGEGYTLATHLNLTEAFANIDNSIPIKKDIDMVCISTAFSFAPIQQEACNKAPVPCTKEKGNNPMYVDNDKHIESSKINYLSNRAGNVLYTKESTLPATFKMVDDNRPGTAAELVKRIQDGKFILKDDTKDKQAYDADRFITWRDPAAVKDEDGYKAAMKSLHAAYQDTKDTIAIGTPAEGLAAVKALDAWTPTVGTVAS